MWPVPGKDGRFPGGGTWGWVGYQVVGMALPLRRDGEDAQTEMLLQRLQSFPILWRQRLCRQSSTRTDSNIAHFFFLVNRGIFVPYVSVYTVSTSAASALVWKCSLERQHIFSITVARIVAELRRFVAESLISVDRYCRRKGRNETAHDLFTTAHNNWVLLCLGQSRRSGLGFNVGRCFVFVLSAIKETCANIGQGMTAVHKVHLALFL